MVNEVHKISNNFPAFCFKKFHCPRFAPGLRLAQPAPGMLLLWVSSLLVAIQPQLLGEAF